jgi:hypothetical protein
LELAQQSGGVGPVPTPQELGAIARRLEQAAHNSWQVSHRDWRKAPWCLWLPERPLAEAPGFLERYLDELRSRRRRGDYKALIGAYLRDFDIRRSGIMLISRDLSARVGSWSWPWAERQNAFALFDPERGPERIALACLEWPGGIQTSLEAAGLTGELAAGGFARAAYDQALRHLSRRLRDPARAHAAFVRVVAWSRGEDGDFRFPELRPRLAEALLLPWQQDDPEASLKEEIVRFLLETYKDPRLDKRHWQGVSNEAQEVIRRWLAGAALEQFFKVVDRIAKPEHWHYRGTFWKAYYEHGYVSDAWVIFGRTGAEHAIRAFGKELSFGRFERGSGFQREHAALLLVVGPLTVAVWSHDGANRIWFERNRLRPQLYRSYYSRAELMEGFDERIVNAGAASGTWQARMRDLIHHHTGVRLSSREYMPRQGRHYE